MSAAAHIRVDAGAEEVGLATVIAELIRQNLERSPRKWEDFRRLDSHICLEARDAEVAVTLAFTGGDLVVRRGIEGRPALLISASSRELLGLALVRIVLGLPLLFGTDGRTLRRGLLSGRVKIAGMFARPVQLIRFTRLMSVNS